MKLSFISFLLPAAICLACSGPASSQKQAATYPMMKVERSTQTVSTSYPASLEGIQIVEIRPQVTGLITDICINEGDPVKKGQTLFIINQVPYKSAMEVAQANVQTAQAQVATARLNYDSNKMLYEKEVISAYDLQSSTNALAAAESALAQARAQLDVARQNYSFSMVKSPVDGVAGMIPYRVGALVNSNVSEPLVTVADISSVYAYFAISENRISSLDLKGRKVGLRLSDGSEYPLEGEVDAVSGIVDRTTGAVRVRAKFPNPDSVLRSGASGSVTVSTEVRDCIVIPQSATYEIQEKVFVFKKSDEGKAVSVPVIVNRLNDGSTYIVESGLEVGDEIVSSGAGLLKEGTVL